jgi:hypothetical protein
MAEYRELTPKEWNALHPHLCKPCRTKRTDIASEFSAFPTYATCDDCGVLKMCMQFNVRREG